MPRLTLAPVAARLVLLVALAAGRRRGLWRRLLDDLRLGRLGGTRCVVGAALAPAASAVALTTIAAFRLLAARDPAAASARALFHVEFLGADPFDVNAGDRLADQLLDRRDEAAVLGRRQREGAPAAAGAAGAADPVDVILGVDRDVEIEDVAEALDVEAAGRDVGGDQEADLVLP